jgi:hypothetical protein
VELKALGGFLKLQEKHPQVKVKFLIIERRVFFSNAYQILSLGVGVVK